MCGDDAISGHNIWGVCQLLILFGIRFKFVYRIGVVLLSRQMASGFCLSTSKEYVSLCLEILRHCGDQGSTSGVLVRGMLNRPNGVV